MGSGGENGSLRLPSLFHIPATQFVEHVPTECSTVLVRSVTLALAAVLSLSFAPAGAQRLVTYRVNFNVITDFEKLRPLVEKCFNLGAAERYRVEMERNEDLEELRELFERSISTTEFTGCPPGLSFPGVD